jgi:hypothetical protein
MVAVAGLVVVLAAGAGAVWLAGGFRGRGSSGPGNGGGLYGTTTAAVRRETLSAQTAVNATLGYAGSNTVTAPGSSPPGSPGSGSPPTFTWLPHAGQVIGQGQVLYRVDNGSPVVLLHGRVPDWRAMSEAITGADVAQLNHDLVKLGYAGHAGIAVAGWDYYSWETAYGVQRLEEHLGVSSPSGSLSLGQAVFEPAALRVARVTGSLGGAAAGPVLAATSDRHVVTIPLDTSQESEVKAGDTVSITLPDGASRAGVVSSVGTVATTSQSQAGGATTTIPVQVRLTDPRAAGSLDQAPVTVYITTATARDVLAVPAAALVARPGGYAVEVVSPGGGHRLVRVRPGLFDDAAGMVQVTGPGVTAAQRVVVPAS